MKKGNQIGVDGRLQSRTYEGQDGKTVYVTEVVADSVQFLEPKNASQGGGQGSSGFQPNQNYNQNQNQQQNYNQGNQNQNDPFSNEGEPRSEEHTSELQSRGHLVC